MKKNTEPTKYTHIYQGVVFILLALLFTLSLVQGEKAILEDYGKLQNSDLSFLRVITLDFPVVDNYIGPFGAFFGFIIYRLFGLYFAFSALLALFVLGILTIAFPLKKEPFLKALFFIGFAFCTNIFLLAVSPVFEQHSGFFIRAITFALKSIFNKTGTAIISFTVSVGFLLLLIETNRMLKILSWLWGVILSFFRMFKKDPKKVTAKPKKEKKTKPPVVDDGQRTDEDTFFIPPVKPTITDHKDIRKPVKRKEVPGEGIDDLIADDDSSELPSPEKKAVKPPVKKPPISNTDNDHQDEKYKIPPIDMFLQAPPVQPFKNKEEIETYINATSRILIDKLARLGIEAEVVNVNVGPVITQFELKPAPNVKVSRFSNVGNDLALAIKARSIRVQAPIPGKGLVGVEIPNRDRETIFLKEVLESEQMVKHPSKLAIAMGKDIIGNPVVADLAKMPHLLIAGATGSGKSVCVNSIICNLLFRAEPDELRMVLIDPKRIELSGYEGIPHLIQDIVSDHEEALTVLQWAVNEMERRYELLQQYNVRDITSFNKKAQATKDAEDAVKPLPFVIIVIDEFADLILKSGRDVEMPITRLAQMARAIGIHLIIATQRPSMKIITGLIKANFPAKIAFRVAQKIDSRVILDMNGAESLLGSGDMLMITPSKALPERIHGTYVSDEEIENLVQYLRTQPKPQQQIEIVSEISDEMVMLEYDDELFIEAARIVIATGSASVSMLQRHFKIGYARAGRLVDMLEQAKIIGKYAGSKSRDITVTDEIMKLYGL